MIRSSPIAVLAMLILSSVADPASPAVMSVWDLSKDFTAYRDKVVTIRGVYYYGLRQDCPQNCADGPWPSFVNLEGGAAANWNALSKVQQTVEVEAKKTGKRFEIWVTVMGRVQTRARRSPLGPCDRKSWGMYGYGHLGAFPAQIVVESIRDIDVKKNAQSLYDYGNMYHGPA
jgi:hypothetical protein